MKHGSAKYDLQSQRQKNDSLLSSVSMATTHSWKGGMSMLRQDVAQGIKQGPCVELVPVVSMALAARYWFVHRKTAEMAVNKGKVAAIKINDFWYVSVDDLNALWGQHTPSKSEVLYIDRASLSLHVGYKGAKLAKRKEGI